MLIASKLVSFASDFISILYTPDAPDMLAASDTPNISKAPNIPNASVVLMQLLSLLGF